MVLRSDKADALLDHILGRIENEPKKLLSGQDVAYVLRALREQRAEIEQLKDERERLSNHYQGLMRECDEKTAEVERLKKVVGQAFDTMDNRRLVSGPKHFTRYPCECGGMVSNSGVAAAAHRRGSIHRQNMERKTLGLGPV
jgi:hypothetical protein